MNTAYVDLSRGMVRIIPTEADLVQRFLGGRGFAAKLLFDRVGPDVDPLEPENLLIVSNGPLTGTGWPASSRCHVTFKSPLTGAYGYANTGGHFGPELRRAGFDALVISGRAERPVYLEITDDQVRIVPAEHLWGQSTSTVHDHLLNSPLGGGRVACIGVAGENQVPLAAIINDYSRAAARAGGGAVMGSKHLKAIHVRATRRLRMPAAFRRLGAETSRRLMRDPRTAGLIEQGTTFLIRPKNMSGDLPAKNHQLVQVPFVDRIAAEALHQGWVVEKVGCFACPIRCSRVSEVKTEPYRCRLEGPEYETTDAFGPMCWNDDYDVIIYANYLCNELGLDTISTGVAIAFAMECHEKGLLSDPDFSLEWGDADTILGLVRSIGGREGLGATLCQGVQRAAGIIGQGAEAYAMHVKGMELPRQEPRFAKGFGLGHATSNRGADHLYGLPAIDLAGALDVAQKLFPAEIVSELMEPDCEKYKPDMVIYGEHYCALTDALGICKFTTAENYVLLPEDLAPGLQALGMDLSGEDLLRVGERIVNLERLYNIREGFSRADDRLPARFTQEPADLYGFAFDEASGQVQRSERPIATGIIHDWDAMLDRYYRLRGWDLEGRPLPDTLLRLGLEIEGRSALLEGES
jgi:aldehyde:ferredoxin oxidoreductase